MGYATRVIASGGTATVPPSLLRSLYAADLTGQGQVTDQWGRVFDSPSNRPAEFGGTPPHISGGVRATGAEDTVIFFEYD